MPIFVQVTSLKQVKIDGEGVFPEHSGWLILDSFSFGKSPGEKEEKEKKPKGEKPAAAPTATPENPQDPNYYGNSVVIQRMFDVASPYLMKWLLDGDPRTVVFDHCTPAGISLFKMKLESAVLVDYYTSALKDNGIPESLEISWEEFTMDTAEIGPDGKPKA